MDMNTRGFMLLLVAETIVIVFIFKLMLQYNLSVSLSSKQGKETSHRQLYSNINAGVPKSSKASKETFQSFPHKQKHYNINANVHRSSKASNKTFLKIPHRQQYANINAGVVKTSKADNETFQRVRHGQEHSNITTNVANSSIAGKEPFQSFPLRQQHSNISVDVAKPPKASDETFKKFTQSHQQSNISMTDELNKIYTHLMKSMPSNSVDCRALFNGSETELKKAKILVKATPEKNQELQAEVLIRRTTNCKIYIETHGYIMSGMTEKEVSFPIAYSIIMYSDVLQVEHLLRAIYRPQNIYCIHVDAKSSNATFSAIQSIAKCFPNVFLLEPRISVVWGELSVLEVELMCMKGLLERNRFWKYFINLTGQEFPLKTNSELVDILTAFNGSNSVFGEHKTVGHYLERYANAGPQPMSPVIGSVHIVVNREFVQFALHDARAERLYNWAKNTSFPDETFFSSLNLNPALQIPGSYKYIDLKAPSEIFINRFKIWHSSCKGKQLRYICLLGVDYLPELSTAPQLFANKFIWNDDNLSLHCLDQLLHNRTREALTGQSSFNASWYSTLDFVVNKLLRFNPLLRSTVSQQN